MRKIKETIKTHAVVARYLLFGLFTTFVSWFTYFGVLLGGRALLELPPEDTSSGTYLAVYTAAQVLQWMSAVFFAFFTNKKWVFTNADDNTSTAHQLGVFASGRVVTFFVDYGVTFFGTMALVSLIPSLNSVTVFGKELNINEMSAKLVAAIIVVVSNYFFSKKLVFKNKEPEQEEDK